MADTDKDDSKRSQLVIRTKQMTPEEQAYVQRVDHEAGRILKLLEPYSWDVQLNIMQQVFLQVVRRFVPQGKKGAFVETFKQQIDRRLKKDAGSFNP